MTALAIFPASDSEVILLPSERFFVRLVPLALDADVQTQVELALEGSSPFPVPQLYYGFVPAPAGNDALIFAAYRKRFTPEETRSWPDATAVWPMFLALVGESPRTPTIRLWVESDRITALAWNGVDPLPVAMLTGAKEELGEQGRKLAGELRDRTNLPEAVVQEFTGAVRVQRAGEQGRIRLELSGTAGAPDLVTVLDPEAGRSLDVRDKGFLTEHRVILRRGQRLWRSLQICAGGLAAALVLEVLMLAGSFALQKQREDVQQHAAEVRKIETAQTLGTRIEELAQRRLMPFEMLALVNQSRPASIQFLRTTTTSLYGLEIEAQTGNAPDVGQYESALRARPELNGVETRELRSREGVTSFILTVSFRPESLHGETGP